jgi:hypothetical protein
VVIASRREGHLPALPEETRQESHDGQADGRSNRLADSGWAMTIAIVSALYTIFVLSLLIQEMLS